MSEDNKAKVRQFYAEVIQKGNLAIVDQIAAPHIVDHNPIPGQAPGVEGIRQAFTALRAAVTDLRISVDHIVAEGDKVAAHVSVRGKHTGELMGIPPSGKEVVMRISDVVRFENGKVVERWGVEDMSGFLPQSGS